MTGFVLLASNILLETSAQLCFKIASMPHALDSTWTEVLGTAFDSPWLLLGYLVQASQLPIWLSCLARLDLSLAFPLMGLSQATIALASWWFLGESPGPKRLLGVALIMVGSAFIPDKGGESS